MLIIDILVIFQICPILPCKFPVSNLRLCPDHRLPRLVVRHTLCLSSLPQLGQVQISHFSGFKYLIAFAQVVFGLSFRRFTSTSSPPASDHSLSAVELNRLSTMEVKKETKKPNSGHVACEKASWSCCAVDSVELWICVER